MYRKYYFIETQFIINLTKYLSLDEIPLNQYSFQNTVETKENQS